MPSAKLPRLRCTLLVHGNEMRIVACAVQTSVGQEGPQYGATAAAFSFGNEERRSMENKAGVPGPGAYRCPASLGTDQPDARKQTAPRSDMPCGHQLSLQLCAQW